MHDMIKKIIETNKADLEKRKSEVSVVVLQEQIFDLPKAQDFYGAFKNFGIIAEVKLASPSAGIIADKSQVLEIVQDYREGKADAISVITEKYFFKGDTNFIAQIKKQTGLPILQKDFVVDSYQILESRVSGADALLLIAKIIPVDKLKEFVDVCLEIGVEPVVEINDEEDLTKALETKARIIAVNARDLDTFEVDVEKACELIGKIPEKFLKLGFSGVNSREEVEKYQAARVKGILVGTKLVKSESRKEFLEGLR